MVEKETTDALITVAYNGTCQHMSVPYYVILYLFIESKSKISLELSTWYFRTTYFTVRIREKNMPRIVYHKSVRHKRSSSYCKRLKPVVE